MSISSFPSSSIRQHSLAPKSTLAYTLASHLKFTTAAIHAYLLKMLATVILLASALVAAEPAPYKLGSVSKNPSLGLGRRQDAGYSPTQTYCGPGTDCASSCGATYIQCASSDDALHCYDPTIKESCCPDGTGSM